MSKKITAVPVKNVTVEDGFWSDMQKKVIDVAIPYQEKILNDEIEGVEKSHALANFRIAAGMEEGEFYGMVFQDSDVAKWLEGVAYSLTVKPDPDLEARADAVIDTIEKAQQPDGYLNTYFTIKEPEHRWQNLQECHELYCAGHMMEAAVAYYECTGKDKLLKVMCRMADHINERFGPEDDKEKGIPGHEEVEIGLLRVYRATGEKKYLDLANYFINQRGKDPDYFIKEKEKRGWVHFDMHPEDREYNQQHKTVYEQDAAVGHAVRALYLYTAMADLAGETDNAPLKAACEKLWNNVTKKQMYITAGVGSTYQGEAFTKDYDLPNDSVYAETCASIALVFFAKKMLQMEVKGDYADVMERAFYNGTISGMQLDGKRFFYVNPLEVNPGLSGVTPDLAHVLPQRPGWYRCACCPPNLVRMVTSLGSYAWDESEDTIYSHMFVGQSADLTKAAVEGESSYPWEGKVVYHVSSKTDDAFTFAIHIPSYIKAFDVTLNGQKIETADAMKDGYLYLTGSWGVEDIISISFDLPVRKIYANQKVKDNAAQAALMRGPIVYCFEGVDNGEEIQSILLPKTWEGTVETVTEGMLKGMCILKGKAYRMQGSDELYSEEAPTLTETEVTAIPYYAWGNRGLNQMRVWMNDLR